jgi:hypothetical protein
MNYTGETRSKKTVNINQGVPLMRKSERILPMAAELQTTVFLSAADGQAQLTTQDSHLIICGYFRSAKSHP